MDEKNFKEQFLPLHPRLYRIIYALVTNKQDAEDILQDAYCKLWDKRNELPEIRNKEAFCVTMVKNLSLDFLRSTAKNKTFMEIGKQEVIEDRSPETELLENDKLFQINRLIGKLPENQKQVLILRGIKECSMEEIEEITGLNPVNIRVLLSRARKLIREQIKTGWI